MELLIWHFFEEIPTETFDWECVLNYLLEESGSHCEIIREVTADVIDSQPFPSEGEFLTTYINPMLHPETVEAFRRHWANCFPTFHYWENMMTGADDIRSLVPEDDWWWCGTI